ncbi:Pentatricopeptide repeat-containing protein At1g34160 [Linum perenne]
MSKRDIASWNALISGLAQGEEPNEALSLFKRIGGDGFNPNEITVLGALSACSQLGAFKEGNVEMAETVTRKLVEMGSKSDGNFVLLSNIYASHERWGDVGRVRQVMKNKDVRKIPGFSYIEEKGEIHKFYNGDKSHDNWKKIYAKLEEIRFKMKEFGYVAETSFVLHDIGDEEKENALYQHSEKLAVAYGLVCANDEDGTPIQVIKNLRICGDCHVVMKLVSKMYNREIIVRDRVRFHRFKDGICSCRDYW